MVYRQGGNVEIRESACEIAEKLDFAPSMSSWKPHGVSESMVEFLRILCSSPTFYDFVTILGGLLGGSGPWFRSAVLMCGLNWMSASFCVLYGAISTLKGAAISTGNRRANLVEFTSALWLLGVGYPRTLRVFALGYPRVARLLAVGYPRNFRLLGSDIRSRCGFFGRLSACRAACWRSISA